MSGRVNEKYVYELLNGFLKSKALITAFQLDLFTKAHDEPMTEAELIAEAGWPARSGEILVNACLALGLLHRREDDTLEVPEGLVDPLVRRPEGGFVLAQYQIDYYDKIFRDLVDMPALVESNGGSSGFEERRYFQEDVNAITPELAASYSTYMNETMARIVEVVLENYDFGQHSSLLDICAGPGTFCTHVVRATEGLKGAFLDVPAVVEFGTKNVAKDLVDAGRITPMPGDVFALKIPEGVDVVTICRAALDWGDEAITGVFRSVFEQLPQGARFMIIERMIPDHVDESDLYLCLREIYFLCKSQTTKYRSANRYVEMLKSVGFGDVHVIEPSRDANAFFEGLKLVWTEK